MKRTIKFRAWHKENKRMYILGWNKLPNADVFVTIADLFKYGEDAILMQFTGLLDKNGFEIYEGDIVQWITDADEGDRKIKEKVFFDGGAFYPVCLMPGYEYEIIGNEFENPELL